MVATVLLALAAAAGLAIVGSRRTWVFETTAVLAALAGFALAAGVFDRLPGRQRTTTVDHADPALRAALARRLASLDAVEHRRVELGDPWPNLVVGPTGVSVVAPASTAHAQVAGRLLTVADEVQRALSDTVAADLPVRALLVVAPGDTGTHAATDHATDTETDMAQGGDHLADGPPGVRRIEVDAVLETLARGRLAPLGTIATAYGRLAGRLTMDLRVAS